MANMSFSSSLPQASQLYYDNNTGIYYCYDADSGRYQFHSKIEVMPDPDHKTAERKGKLAKKGSKKCSLSNHKVRSQKRGDDA